MPRIKPLPQEIEFSMENQQSTVPNGNLNNNVADLKSSISSNNNNLKQNNTAKPRKRKSKVLAQHISNDSDKSSVKTEASANDLVVEDSLTSNQNKLANENPIAKPFDTNAIAEYHVEQLASFEDVENKPNLVSVEICSDVVLTTKKLEKDENLSNSPIVDNSVINHESLSSPLSRQLATGLKTSKHDNETIDIFKTTNDNATKHDKSNNLPQKEEKIAESIEGGYKSESKLSPQVGQIKSNLKVEESEDIDAGIELDGSSNSGSSVKDMNDEQTVSKLTSVSPTLSPLLHSDDKINNIEFSSKKLGLKKLQLTANLQDIDKDEEQLQLKLRKQLSGRSSSEEQTNSAPVVANRRFDLSDKSSMTTQRRLSRQTSQDASIETSLCKICNTHVYQMERMLAEKSLFHKKCFRCYNCNIQLNINSYASHEGQVYCKAHYRQIIQPIVNVDNENDVDIVARSNIPQVDDYLLKRGRLSDLSFSFLKQQSSPGTRKRQMTICENEPAELPKDVVRCNDKLDDGQINVNLVNIKEKFEMASQRQQRDLSQTTIIDKPSINIRKTLLAFESKSSDSTATNSPDQFINSSIQKPQTIVSNSIKQIANGFLSNSIDTSDIERTKPSPIPARRTGSLMMRLQRYESRIAGNSIDDDDDDDSGEDDDDDEDDDGCAGSNDNCDKNRVGIESTSDLSHSDSDHSLPVNIKKNELNKKNKVQQENGKDGKVSRRKNSGVIISSSNSRPKLFVDLSSLKNQWESGQIVNKRVDSDEDDEEDTVLSEKQTRKQQDEELRGIRMSLARKKEGESVSIKNIYENAIKQQKQQDRLATAGGDSLRGIGKAAFNNFKEEFLNRKQDNGNNYNYANGNSNQTTNKTNGNINDNKSDFSSLKFKTNELKQRFELGIVSNSLDDSDEDSNIKPISKLEQLRQEKLDDLSVFTEGEIKAREARSLFQQIDKSLTVANGFSTKH